MATFPPVPERVYGLGAVIAMLPTISGTLGPTPKPRTLNPRP